MAKHLKLKKRTKRLNIKILFSFLAMAFLFFMLFNFKNISAYFNDIVEKINNVTVEPQYTITFYSNTGTGSMDIQEISYNEITKLNKNIYKKTGYSFTNWNTKADNTGISYTNEEEVTNLGDITLYAQWELNPTRYAVQIYGINQDVDEDDNVLGLTFGPALGANYNNAYVTHEYVKNEEGTYNIEIVTTTFDEYGNENEEKDRTELLDANNNNVTRTEEQVQKRKNINLHEMSWSEIVAVEDKTLFEDCMLCGDTKKVEITWNDIIKTDNVYDQYGDGAGILAGTVDGIYRKWNSSQSQNSYVGSEESGVELDEYETEWGSNAKSAGGYSSSHIRATLIGENEKTNRGYAGDENLTTDTCIYSCIQEDLRDLIVPKKVKYVIGTKYAVGNYSLNSDIADSIWLFSEREIRGIGQYSGNELEGLGESGEAYRKFVNPESRSYIATANNDETNIRVFHMENGSTQYLWLRSLDLRYTYYARVVNYSSGKIGTTGVCTSFSLRIWLLYFRF